MKFAFCFFIEHIEKLYICIRKSIYMQVYRPEKKSRIMYTRAAWNIGGRDQVKRSQEGVVEWLKFIQHNYVCVKLHTVHKYLCVHCHSVHL
jgi:hypothetical protein